MDKNFFSVDGKIFVDGVWVDPKEEGDTEVDTSVIPAFRRVICVRHKEEEFDEDGNLIDNKYKKVYKIVSDSPENIKEQGFVVKNDDGEYYCIRQGCYLCEYRNECEPRVKIEYDGDIICSLDISSQEPYQVTLLSREPKYLALFRNRTLRENGLVDYLDYFVGKHFNFNPDEHSYKSEIYWEWLSQFHWNWGELIEFNKMIDEYKENEDEEVFQRIKQMLNKYYEELNKLFEKGKK